MSRATPASDEVLDAVREDAALAPREKETTIRFAKDEDVATVFTAEAGLTRRLLAHPEASTVGVVVVDGDARPEVMPSEVNGRAVVGVRARVPVGALNVRSSARKSGGHADVVTERVLGGDRR
jgi:hypothetical protein